MFEHLRMQQQVREAVARGARARARAASWTVVTAASAIVGVVFAGMAVQTGAGGSGTALVAFAAIAPAGVRAYWAWNEVHRIDHLVVDIVTAFAERAAAARRNVEQRSATAGVLTARTIRGRCVRGSPS